MSWKNLNIGDWQNHWDHQVDLGLSHEEYCHKYNLRTGHFRAAKSMIRKQEGRRATTPKAEDTSPFVELRESPSGVQLRLRIRENLIFEVNQVPSPRWVAELIDGLEGLRASRS